MCFIEPRIYTHYKNVICQDIIYTCNIKNIMELPQITHGILNASSPSIPNKNSGLAAQTALQAITGQKSKITRAHKSIAPFQLRKNNLLGCVVGLRGHTLYSFIDQYITLVCSSVVPKYRTIGGADNALQLGRVVENKKKGHQIANFNFGGESFQPFPGLQFHFLAFSTTGGYNCTFCAMVKDKSQLVPFLTAFQMPIL